MGNTGFTIMHWAMLAPFLLLIAALGFVIYLVLRKRPLVATTTDAAQPGTPASLQHGTSRGNIQKMISIAYLVGGAIGILTLIPQLDGVSYGFLDMFGYLFGLAQVAAALYGGWQFWNNKPIGMQVLYWLSWTCVPLLSFTMLTYWCAMGLGFFPTIALGLGNFGADFSFRFGYAGGLYLGSYQPGLLVGANLVALAFVHQLGKAMATAGVPRWPLMANRTESASDSHHP